MKYPFVLICLLIWTPNSSSQELITARTDSLIRRGIRLSIEQSFDQAIDLFSGLQAESPENPAGYFFHAAVLQLQMMDYEEYDKEQQFLTLIDTTVTLSRARIRLDRDDAWAYFFLGSAYGYLAFYQAKQNDFVGSFKNGRKSVKALENALALDDQLYDVYLALGNYKYYRSKLSRHLTWLPFVEDEREQAIEMLKTTIEKGRYSKYSAMNSYCWITLEEKNYQEGRRVVNLALSEFPESRVFLWCAAKLAMKLERWQEAEQHYSKILKSLSDQKILSPYNELICRKNLFYIYQRLEKEKLAEEQCQRVARIKTRRKNQKRSEKILDELVEPCKPYLSSPLLGQTAK